MRTLLLVLAGVLGCAEPALALPQFVRAGYPACASCHVNPGGGGALTAYGRSASEELSTWAVEGQGRVLGVLELPESVAVGGDVRYVNINVPDLRYHRKFLMQADVELGLRLAPNLWAVASVGTYGEAYTREYRRNYLLFAPTETSSLRVGRFMPQFGIMQPDHTVATRSRLGWGQGKEAYAVEASVRGSVGEVFLTSHVGGEATQRLSRVDGYQVRARDVGMTARAAVYVGDKAQVGASYSYSSNPEEDWRIAGPHVQWGVTRSVTLLTEGYGRWSSLASRPTYFTWSEASVEVFRGLAIAATHEFVSGDPDDTHIYGYSAQWLLTPHWELKGQGAYKDGLWSYTALFHYWI